MDKQEIIDRLDYIEENNDASLVNEEASLRSRLVIIERLEEIEDEKWEAHCADNHGRVDMLYDEGNELEAKLAKMDK